MDTPVIERVNMKKRTILTTGASLIAAAGLAFPSTAQAQAPTLSPTDTTSRTTDPAPVETSAQGVFTVDDARAAQVAISAAGGGSLVSLDPGPGGAYLARVLLQSGAEVYIIEDPAFVVRSIRVAPRASCQAPASGRDISPARASARLAPGVAERDQYRCGPPGLTAAVRSSLHRAGLLPAPTLGERNAR